MKRASKKRGRLKAKLSADDAGPPLRSLMTRRLGLRVLLAVITAASLSAMMVQWRPRAGTAGLEVGDIAPSDVRARSSFEVVDTELTAEKERQAREQTPPLFEFDVVLNRDIEARIDKAFDGIRERQAELEQRSPVEPSGGGDGDPVGGDDAVEGSIQSPPGVSAADFKDFEDRLGVSLRDIDQANLLASGFDPQLQRDIKVLVRVAMRDPIVRDRDVLPREGSISVSRIEGLNRREYELDERDRIRDLKQARDFISSTAAEDFSDRPAHLLDTIVHLARELTIPNLRFNASESQVRRQLAASAVKPVTTSYQRGQIILRSGEPVRPWTLAVIEQMNADIQRYHPLTHLAALSLLMALLLGLVEGFAERYVPRFRCSMRDLLAMAALLIFVSLISLLLHNLGTALVSSLSRIPLAAYAYAVPVAAGAIIVRTLMGAETAVVWSMIAALVCAAIMDVGLNQAAFYLTGSLAAAGGIGSATERGRLIRAGFVSALVNVVVVLSIDLVIFMGLQGSSASAMSATGPIFHVMFALAGGLVSGVLAVGVTPLFEQLGFLTDSKLLELSNLNHPLLREMIVRAPGTYHHSMMVGSLGETAAKAIGANSLLVRVGANFHDIGKMLKPLYFIENQRGSENPHDRLSPNMSALVILSHVKEGIELGREHGLPEPIIDMIPEHHGTSLVSFFYNKALQQQDEARDAVQESDFRYPGPRPQTREAAIMMLADVAEAATRSLKNHTHGSIRQRVESIFNKIVSEGQLDECPLTLRDLHVISDSFVQSLQGIYHHRVEYPKPAPTRGKGISPNSISLELPPKTPPPEVGAAQVDAAARSAEKKRRLEVAKKVGSSPPKPAVGATPSPDPGKPKADMLTTEPGGTGSRRPGAGSA